MASGSSSTLKLVAKMVDKAEETFESQDMLCNLVEMDTPDPSTMQNTAGVIWQDVEQHSPIEQGWDLTGKEEGLIQEQYPLLLTDNPYGNLIDLRADDYRDDSYIANRVATTVKRHISNQNKTIAETIRDQGSLYYDSAATDGFSFIGEAQKVMNQRQSINNGRHFVLNDAETLTFAAQLANRETVKGRPESAWQKGQIGSQVAEFDIHTGSYLPTLTGTANPASTVTGNQSFAPQSGTVVSNTVVTNFDYRTADVPVSTSVGYVVGDKIKFTNGGTDVFAVGLDDKTNTLEAMTFTVVAVPDGTTITIFPKPIAADDAALSALEKSYANIDTTIDNLAVVNKLNIATKRTNLFFDKDAVRVQCGEISAAKMTEFGGMKHVKLATPGGQPAYLLFDGDVTKMTFQWRFFFWWQVTMANPQNAGVAVL